ncbi:unnamed protein product, partial [Brenthis ino]
MAFAICFGFAVATIAGVAYGYNYSLAEFVTLTRSDVNMYMRRGQFYDNPDLLYPKRRMGDDENVEDYQQEVPTIHNPGLSDTLQKNHDTRKYAEKVTKYSDSRRNLVDYEQVKLPQTAKMHFVTPTHNIVKSTSPKLLFFTITKQSGSSNIIMRMFEPIQEFKSKTKHDFDRNEEYSRKIFDNNIKYYQENKPIHKVNSILNTKIGKSETISPDIRILFEGEDDHESPFKCSGRTVVTSSLGKPSEAFERHVKSVNPPFG